MRKVDRREKSQNEKSQMTDVVLPRPLCFLVKEKSQMTDVVRCYPTLPEEIASWPTPRESSPEDSEFKKISYNAADGSVPKKWSVRV